MGTDKVRHFVTRKLAGDRASYFWQPSITLQNLGLSAEALGCDLAKAKERALQLNAMADQMRLHKQVGDNGPVPGTVTSLIAAYKSSHEFSVLKLRTRKDYSYYLEKFDEEFARILVRSMKPRVLKTYYHRLLDERGNTWAYHVIGCVRAMCTWAVTEEWIDRNPAISLRVRAPSKRKVIWKPEQTDRYVEFATALGWHSVATMISVFDCVGQSPIDVINMRVSAYDGRSIAVTREKTGVSDAPIPLWPDVIKKLDTYLATRSAVSPDEALFVNEKTGGKWFASTLAKVHSAIREAAGLPKELQLQDFRRTAATEAGAAGGTADEIRAVQRHSTRHAALHYVHPDNRYVEALQAKREAYRKRQSPSVPEMLE